MSAAAPCFAVAGLPRALGAAVGAPSFHERKKGAEAPRLDVSASVGIEPRIVIAIQNVLDLILREAA
ncbi:hypothetical protein GCM10009081_22480 [Brevundimonas nasdae]